jgi:hypothetical protein
MAWAVVLADVASVTAPEIAKTVATGLLVPKQSFRTVKLLLYLLLYLLDPMKTCEREKHAGTLKPEYRFRASHPA